MMQYSTRIIRYQFFVHIYVLHCARELQPRRGSGSYLPPGWKIWFTYSGNSIGCALALKTVASCDDDDR